MRERYGDNFIQGKGKENERNLRKEIDGGERGEEHR